ncbi:MAG: CDP-alcohol phosphatidyltransferase family protein [Oligoflexia bacterium]|nr:CDP-alcohol phosphatidyltransferase family protein [Oligoflexia bacterium]
MKTPKSGRRPVKSRETGWARAIAKRLTRAGITPNLISILSAVFATLGASALVSWPEYPGAAPFVGAILGIQLRLLCNLFDGMVAVEGGKKSKSGELFNDIPDRISDSVLLVALGYAIPGRELGPALGWAAALAATLTAYVRTLATSAGAPVSFAGPMAKQHRMAVLTLACLAAGITLAVKPGATPAAAELLWLGLVVILAGSVLTVLRRAWDAYRELERC